jgi:hypothetical protein
MMAVCNNSVGLCPPEVLLACVFQGEGNPRPLLGPRSSYFHLVLDTNDFRNVVVLSKTDKGQHSNYI